MQRACARPHAPPPSLALSPDGVPWPVDLDTLFGSTVEMAWCEKTRTPEGKISLRRAKAFGRLLRERGSEAAALAALAEAED